VRQFVLPAAAAAAVVTVAVLVAPLLASGAAVVTESSVALNNSLGALIVSPAGYVLGGLAVAAALVDTFRR
jgi:hypothetical protein